MKTIFTTVFYFALVFSLSAQGEVVNTTFSSSSFDGEAFSLNVYLPEGYDENAESYPLYIFLHGCCGLNHQTHIDDFEARLNQLIADGDIDPLVVVLPSAQGADFGNRHLWFNSERNGNYGDLITSDLLAFVESNYNTSTSRRAIGGFSMGADGALRLGLHNSNKFVGLVSHSSFSAIENLGNIIPTIINETGQASPPYNFIPSNGLYTQATFGISTVWSPNFSNPPYEVDFPLNDNGELIEEVFNEWKSIASPDSIIRQNWSASKEVPTSIYFDVGNLESLFDFFETNNLLNTQLQNLVQEEGYSINYKYNVFSEGHTLSLSRIDSSLIWLNQVFSDAITSNHKVTKGDLKLSIFPNPAMNSIGIKLTGISNSGYRIEIVNMNGKLVESNFVNGLDNLNLDVSNYESGTYNVLIESEKGNQRISGQFIKI